MNNNPDFKERSPSEIIKGMSEDIDRLIAEKVTLQKENERLKEKLTGFDSFLDTLNDQAKKEFESLQSEITRLKEERDSFAIGFAKWIDKGPYFLHGLTTWKSVDVREPIITDNELIDLYKETLKT